LRGGDVLGLHRRPRLDRLVFAPDDPLVFDEQFRAKPAFFGVQDAFLGR
jgi:hypothetical protein